MAAVHTAAVHEGYAIEWSRPYGEGTYGTTFAARDLKTGEWCAVKVMNMLRVKISTIYAECSALEKIHHESVVRIRCHGPNSERNLYFIFMEALTGGEVFDKVMKHTMLSESESLRLFAMMLDGVRAAHSAGVAHRDLKLENFVLSASGEVKLIDFGLSHIYPRQEDGTVDRSAPLHSISGSRSYAAPEAAAGTAYDGFEADVWSLGICLFAMLSGSFPVVKPGLDVCLSTMLIEAQAAGGQATTVSAYSRIRRANTHFSEEVLELIDAMLHLDPKQRPTTEQVRRHPWLAMQQVQHKDPARGQLVRSESAESVTTSVTVVADVTSSVTATVWPPAPMIVQRRVASNRRPRHAHSTRHGKAGGTRAPRHSRHVTSGTRMALATLPEEGELELELDSSRSPLHSPPSSPRGRGSRPERVCISAPRAADEQLMIRKVVGVA